MSFIMKNMFITPCSSIVLVSPLCSQQIQDSLSLPGVIRLDIWRSIEESTLTVLYCKSNKSFIQFGGLQLEIN